MFLLREKKTALTAMNQRIAAVRFFYKETLGQDRVIDRLRYPRRPKRLPTVMSKEEVFRLFVAVRNLKHRMVLMMLSSTGIRVSELTRLQVAHIDSKRIVIPWPGRRVHQGKGKKGPIRSCFHDSSGDAEDILEEIPTEGFCLPIPAHALSPDDRAAMKVCSAGQKKAELSEEVTPHTFRHTFTTHLLEAGTDLRTIQIILGYRSLKTTALYLHVAENGIRLRRKAEDLLGVVLNQGVQS